jgi:hypothetical protein
MPAKLAAARVLVFGCNTAVDILFTSQPPVEWAALHEQVLLPLLTWQIKQHKPYCVWMQLLHLPAEQKAATSQGAHQRVEQVEDLLGGPAILRHTQLNAHQLHLHRQR